MVLIVGYTGRFRKVELTRRLLTINHIYFLPHRHHRIRIAEYMISRFYIYMHSMLLDQLATKVTLQFLGRGSRSLHEVMDVARWEQHSRSTYTHIAVTISRCKQSRLLSP